MNFSQLLLIAFMLGFYHEPQVMSFFMTLNMGENYAKYLKINIYAVVNNCPGTK